MLLDVTGNLTEIGKPGAGSHPLMGGSYLSQDAAGATCDFSAYTGDQALQLPDTGFRCCSSADPTL